MRYASLTAGLIGAIVACSSGLLTAADLSDVVGGEVTKVVGDCKFTEGPAWHPDGYLLFSDIPANRIVRVNADGTHSDWMTSSGGANGLMCDQAGNVYAAQGDLHRISRLRSNAEGRGEVVEVLAETFADKALNKPNDLAVDTTGGLYFTDPNYRREPATQPVEGVYYVSKTGQVTRVVEDLPRPNGVLVSADGKTLIVADINRRQIMTYTITGPGSLSNPTVLFKGEEQQDGNGPDGMALDEHGNIYATYKQLVVVSKTGELVGRLPVPEKPANCKFGGPENNTLYITARTGLYQVPMKVRGTSLEKQGPQDVKSTSTVPAAPLDLEHAQPVFYFDDAKATETVEIKLEGLTLNVPKNWEKQTPTSRLRLGQFSIPPVEGETDKLELVVFPPFGGTIDENLRRWVGQFDNQGREMKLTQGECEQGTYYLMDLTGTYKKPVGPPIAMQTEPTENYKMLAVILSHKAGGNMFLRLTGPKKSVAANAEAFRKSFGADAAKEKVYELK